MTDDFRFHTPIKVRYNETDQQGHVNFGHFLFYFDIGLTEYLQAIGFSYPQMVEAGIDMLYVEAGCQYHSPARFPEVLNIHTRIAHLGRRSIRFEFETLAEEDNRRVASGHIVAVTVTSEGFASATIPDELRRAVKDYEGSLPSIASE